MVNIWWCNQTRCWDDERAAGLVCAAQPEGPSGLKYRAMVGRARKGDIVLHYVSVPKKSIVAISRARKDGVEGYISLLRYGVQAKRCWYGNEPGWFFETEYHDFTHPIPRDKINRQIVQLNLEDSPFLATGNVRQAYFLPFELAGLRIIRQASKEPWPEWAEAVLQKA